MTGLAYIGAAVAEIAGCFAFWGWLRLDKPAWWLIPGIASLMLFAYLLTWWIPRPRVVPTRLTAAG